MKSLHIITVLCLPMAVGFSQTNTCDTVDDCQKVIQAKPYSSQAHYRIGEILFQEKNYTGAANEFHDAVIGDLDPRWTEVWSHLQLGKIYDVTNQRYRAIAEYKKAQQTNDNTRGALDEAARYLDSPYK